jgi:rhodanese-related sulfurtransferase
MDKRDFKNSIYEQLARMTKALSNSHRLEIIELLAQGSYSVEQIAEQTDMSVANTSQHLQVMKRVQLVESRRDGVTIYYQLAGKKVYKAWKYLRDLGIEKNAGLVQTLQNFRESRQAIEALTLPELRRKMNAENLSIIDVRPEKEYEQGHIETARSIPVEQLENRINELPKNDEIVVYCRGPFCVFADDAVQLLKSKGYNVKRLDEGYPDWALQGLDTKSDDK